MGTGRSQGVNRFLSTELLTNLPGNVFLYYYSSHEPLGSFHFGAQDLWILVSLERERVWVVYFFSRWVYFCKRDTKTDI